MIFLLWNRAVEAKEERMCVYVRTCVYFFQPFISMLAWFLSFAWEIDINFIVGENQNNKQNHFVVCKWYGSHMLPLLKEQKKETIGVLLAYA